VNPYGRLKGEPYTLDSVSDIWRNASKETGESIRPYAGTKHSSCSQLINEHGYNLFDVQIATDHARLESVKRYAKVEVSARRSILERKKKVVDIGERLGNE
jgi:hypothetical protein